MAGPRPLIRLANRTRDWWRYAFGTANEKDIHGREDWKMTDQFLRWEKSDAEIEGNPESEDDQTRQETGNQRASRSQLNDADQEDKAPVGKPIDTEFLEDIEPWVRLEEGDS